jgi:MOSC domain-containing protein YiiM
MGRIVAVLRSKRKGVAKREIAIGYLRKDYGLVGDAHAGSNRQVSLLALENIKICQQKGLKVGPGDFAENLTTEGIDLLSLTRGQRLFVGRQRRGKQRASSFIGKGIILRYRNFHKQETGQATRVVILEITQIGKKCPAPCAIFRQLGECIMPKEGVFARVVKGGRVRVRAGDRLAVEK